MKNLIDRLSNNPLLSVVSPEKLSQVLPELEQQIFDSQEVIFNKGDAGDAYYIIADGEVEVSDGNTILNELTAGQGFGEMALLSGQPRIATVTAKTNVTLIRVSRQGFTDLLEAEPALATHLYRLMEKRMRHSLLVMTFKRLMDHVDAAILQMIQDTIAWEVYSPGDVLIRQGDIGTDALVLITGRVRAKYHDGLNERILGEVGNASLVGELALLSDLKRTATITAIRETTVVRIDRTTFENLMQHAPTFARRLMTIIVQRQQQNIDQHYVTKPTSLNFVLVPTQPTVDTAKFANNLQPYLANHGRVLVLDAHAFDDHYGIENAIKKMPDIFLRQWLNELEHTYDYICFLPDDSWTDWTQWIIRNADRVLLIGETNGDPRPGELEKQIDAQLNQQHHELVLLHDETVKQPSGTAQWLTPRQVNRHHHIRKGEAAHLARLGRLLTGNGIGLVLGGGGARGYAHIGVLKALTEAQVPIDAIGCVSMGAVVGGAMLGSMQSDDVISQIMEKGRTYGSKKALLDTTIPISAMMASKKVSRAMQGVVGDINIEDGWVQFYCISTNLNRASLNVHRHGKLHEAVRASLSIPGVFSPVVRDGDLVVDGGVMNNYPVDLMREYLEGGTVIGTLVTSTKASKPYEIADHIDGLAVFLSRLLPWKQKQRVPSIVKTILAAQSVNAYSQQADYRQRTDFLIETDTTPYGTLDFDNIWELAEIGYNANRERVQQWLSQHIHLIDQPPPLAVK